VHLTSSCNDKQTFFKGEKFLMYMATQYVGYDHAGEIILTCKYIHKDGINSCKG
jgi:hypothetical protein